MSGTRLCGFILLLDCCCWGCVVDADDGTGRRKLSRVCSSADERPVSVSSGLLYSDRSLGI